jgi:hypothetical protein
VHQKTLSIVEGFKKLMSPDGNKTIFFYDRGDASNISKGEE